MGVIRGHSTPIARDIRWSVPFDNKAVAIMPRSSRGIGARSGRAIVPESA